MDKEIVDFNEVILELDKMIANKFGIEKEERFGIFTLLTKLFDEQFTNVSCAASIAQKIAVKISKICIIISGFNNFF